MLSHYRTLTPGDHVLVMVKSWANPLGFAILLVFCRDRGRFPWAESEIDRNWGSSQVQRILQLNRGLPGSAVYDLSAVRHSARSRKIISKVNMLFPLTRAAAEDPRKELEARLLAKVRKDPAFLEEILRNPVAVTERELGVTLPEGLKIHIHHETPSELHFVMPALQSDRPVRLCGSNFFPVNARCPW
jgi:hypothetical protein